MKGTHNTEEGFLRRLQEFRANNQEDETVLNYFDELEIHPEVIGNFISLAHSIRNCSFSHPSLYLSQHYI